jgi:hypothetical protein
VAGDIVERQPETLQWIIVVEAQLALALFIEE